MDSTNQARWGVMCDCGIEEAVYVELVYCEDIPCGDGCCGGGPPWYELSCPCCGRQERISQLEDIPGFMEAYDNGE